MASEYVKSVGTGKDYSTLAAWQAANGGLASKDLVSQDVVAVAETYTGEDTSALTISGWTTDATRKIRIRPATGYNHGGMWNTAVYRRRVTTATSITVSQAYTEIDGLQIDHACNSGYSAGVVSTVPSVFVRRCIIRRNIAPVSNLIGMLVGTVSATLTAEFCIIYGFSGTGNYGVQVVQNSSTGTFNNLTIYGCTTGAWRYSGYGYVNNTIISGCTTCYSGGWNGSTYNISSDSTASGTGAITNTSPSFVSTASGSEDFHLTSGIAGSDPSSSSPYDIDWQLVTTWYRGADAVPGSASSGQTFSLSSSWSTQKTDGTESAWACQGVINKDSSWAMQTKQDKSAAWAIQKTVSADSAWGFVTPQTVTLDSSWTIDSPISPAKTPVPAGLERNRNSLFGFSNERPKDGNVYDRRDN